MFAFQVFALTALMTRLGIAPIGEGASKAKRVIEVAAAVSWNAGGGEPLLYFKGITVSSNGLMVLVGSGTENYSFTAGEMGAVDSPKGRLIACYSPTTGTGVTTLAANLALALAAWQRIQIPLVELHDKQGRLLPLIGRDPDPHRIGTDQAGPGGVHRGRTERGREVPPDAATDRGAHRAAA